MFDLMVYARQHRLRVRNLHDGRAVPPARARRLPGHRPAFTGDGDRLDAIVGARGYVTLDRDQLGVFAHYASRQGLTYGMRKLAAAGVTITQEGDTECAGWAPVDRIEDVLVAIRVSKLPPGNPSALPRATGSVAGYQIRPCEVARRRPESTQCSRADQMDPEIEDRPVKAPFSGPGDPERLSVSPGGGRLAGGTSAPPEAPRRARGGTPDFGPHTPNLGGIYNALTPSGTRSHQ